MGDNYKVNWTSPVDWHGASDHYRIHFDNINANNLYNDYEKNQTTFSNIAARNQLKVVSQHDQNNQEWNEFTQNTTFHGIRYIFRRGSAVNLRRLLWCLCVLSAVTTFIIQVGVRSSDYLKYHTTQDVRLMYDSKIVFPSVTICNQNNFRLTQAYKLGLYDFLDKAYKVNGQSNIIRELEKLKSNAYVGNMSLAWLDVLLSHRREDTIDSCIWKRQKCSPQHFKRTFTDYGVCFTFNHLRNSNTKRLHADKSGSSYGLSLTINIEQFDYMRGPHMDAGVKVLLHHPDEPPMVEDLGFAIAPGTHTLVGIKRTVMKYLSEPYDNCNSTPGYTIPGCLVTCLAHATNRRCGCTEEYMMAHSDNDTRSCSFRERHSCTLPNIGYTRDINCSRCLPPCTKVTYGQSLSYARLSKFNLQTLAQHNLQKRQKLKQRFQFAREISQRVAPDVAAQDHNDVIRVLEISDQLQTTLNYTYGALRSHERLAKRSNSFDLLSYDTRMLHLDLEMLGSKDSLRDRYSMGMLFRQERADYRVLTTFWDTPIRNIETSQKRVMFSYIEGCVKKQKENKTIEMNAEYKTTREYHYCYSFMASMKRSYLSLRTTRNIMVGTLRRQNVTYHRYMAVLYKDTGVDISTVKPHRKCVALLASFDYRGYIQRVDELVNLTRQFRAANTLERQYSLLQQIYNTSKEYKVLPAFVQPCRWFREAILEYVYFSSRSIEPMAKELSSAIGNFRKASARFPAFRRAFVVLSDTVGDVNKIYTSKYKSYIKKFRTFYNEREVSIILGKTPKLDLAGQISKPYFQNIIQEFIDIRTDLEFSLKTYSEHMSLYRKSLIQSVNDLFNMTIPYLNKRYLNKMQLHKLILAANISKLNKRIGNLATAGPSRGDIYVQMLDEIFESFGSGVRRLVTDLQTPLYTLSRQLQEVQERFKTYTEQSETNSNFYMDNFLQLDIFYKELQYQYIQQQATFVFASLLSEIGGFLGLLLGASVLTVCELLDYITIAAVKRLAKGGERKHDRARDYQA